MTVKMYNRVGGRQFEQAIALNEGVQDYLARLLFEMKARADVELLKHRHEGDAAIEIDHEWIDWYLTLSDERGQKAALSIEYGRQAYIDPETGEEKGAMDGLFILHKATNLRKKRNQKIKLGRRVPRRMKKRLRREENR